MVDSSSTIQPHTSQRPRQQAMTMLSPCSPTNLNELSLTIMTRQTKGKKLVFGSGKASSEILPQRRTLLISHKPDEGLFRGWTISPGFFPNPSLSLSLSVRASPSRQRGCCFSFHSNFSQREAQTRRRSPLPRFVPFILSSGTTFSVLPRAPARMHTENHESRRFSLSLSLLP